MEAKYTVLKSSVSLDKDEEGIHYPTLEEQASVSFKAGIKEVMNYVNNRVPYAFKYFEDEIGKAKLKEWGINQ